MNISVRTLRLETSKKRRPNAPRHPVQLEVARETSMPLFSKNEQENSRGRYNLSLGDPSPGDGEFGVG